MKLPNRSQRAALVLSLTLTASGSLVYLAQATEAPRPTAISIPKITSEVPASVSVSAVEPRPLASTTTVPARTSSFAADIPLPARLAYERAARLLAGVSDCGIEWPLLGALGKIESDHGRHGGSELSPDGVSTPGIIGPALDGTAGTARIADTDGGRFDGDSLNDRAVGPLQFIPSTWRSVGVDADDDGTKNPQDIDDAAAAAAVYLCAGGVDLTDPVQLRAAVLRYNHSETYADQVLAIARSYALPSMFSTGLDNARLARPGAGVTTPSARNDDAVLTTAARPETALPSATAPRASGSPQAGPRPSGDPTSKPTAETPKPAASTKPEPAPADPVAALVTPVQEATSYCTEKLTGAQMDAVGGLSACVAAFVAGGASAVTGLLAGVQDLLRQLLGGT